MNDKIILGIDPALRNTGWGAIAISDNKPVYINSGVVTTSKKLETCYQLLFIQDALNKIIIDIQPTEIAIENIFSNSNHNSSLKLGMTTGIVLAATASHNIKAKQYASTSIKKIITGNGRANKEELYQKIINIFSITDVMKQDAADALAVALCHAVNLELMLKIVVDNSEQAQ